MTGQERDRARIDEKYKWDISDVYSGVDAWRAEKQRIAASLQGMREFAGELASSPKVLADAFDTMYRLEKEISRLFVYASLMADEERFLR